MGFNKAFIDINGQRIIHRTIRLFKELFDEIILATNDPVEYEELDIMAVTDIFKGAGSLGGIYTGLFHAASDYSFVAACDMPFLSKEAIVTVIKKAAGVPAAVPFIHDLYHPLHAVYSKKCLTSIEEMIQGKDLRITNLFQKIKIKKLIEKDFPNHEIVQSIDNINTQDDLHRAITSHPPNSTRYEPC